MPFRPVAGKLHTPRSPSRVGREVDAAARRGGHQPGKLDAALTRRRARGWRVRGRHLRRRLGHPGFRAVAGDDADVGLRLPRQAATAGQPPFDLAGAGIVGRSGQTQVAAECRTQFAQVACRLAQRLQRLERIDKPPHRGGSGHELGDALRARRAHRRWVEAALLPDEPGEELLRNFVVGRRLCQRAADVANEGRRILCFRLGRCVLGRLFVCRGGGGTLRIGARQRQRRQDGGEHHTGCRERHDEFLPSHEFGFRPSWQIPEYLSLGAARRNASQKVGMRSMLRDGHYVASST
jgi:hypothetical protein